jgi:hypothetical protein
MAFDNTQFQPTMDTRGRKGSAIDYSGGDVTISASVKAVVVTAAGNVVYEPVDNASGTNITITGASVGYVLPHVVGLIVKTGSTAFLATIED